MTNDECPKTRLFDTKMDGHTERSNSPLPKKTLNNLKSTRRKMNNPVSLLKVRRIHDLAFGLQWCKEQFINIGF